MNKNIKILLIFSVLFLIGCFPSYSVLPKEYKSVKQIQKREKAFVINKDLKSEYKKHGTIDLKALRLFLHRYFVNASSHKDLYLLFMQISGQTRNDMNKL